MSNVHLLKCQHCGKICKIVNGPYYESSREVNYYFDTYNVVVNAMQTDGGDTIYILVNETTKNVQYLCPVCKHLHDMSFDEWYSNCIETEDWIANLVFSVKGT